MSIENHVIDTSSFSSDKFLAALEANTSMIDGILGDFYKCDIKISSDDEISVAIGTKNLPGPLGVLIELKPTKCMDILTDKDFIKLFFANIEHHYFYGQRNPCSPYFMKIQSKIIEYKTALEQKESLELALPMVRPSKAKGKI